ncbi:MAG: hypothetical protein IT210_17405 [Armatimonadetes bacterium]|nr:hypothetical protein [Armatimonadota bacterium]
MKRLVFVVLFLGILLGAAYALMFFRIVKVDRLAAKSPVMAKALTILKLYRPAPKTAALPGKPSEAADPLQGEKGKLDKDRKALEDREADLVRREQEVAQQRIRMSKAEPAGAEEATKPDPLARLVRIYDKMAPEDASKIFARMNDTEVAALLVKMKEKQVGGILPQLPSDRAARLTRMLSRQ